MVPGAKDVSTRERDATDETRQLRSKLELLMKGKQASMMQNMSEMMAERMRNNGRSEFSSAENSAGAREGLNPLLRDKYLLLLLLLLLGPDREKMPRQHERRHFVRCLA